MIFWSEGGGADGNRKHTFQRKSSGGLQATLDYCMQDEKTIYDGRKFVYGMNCSEQDPYLDMMTTKKLYGKTSGRMYYHLDQSFSPDEKITPEQAHKIAIEFAEEQFKRGVNS